MLSSCKNYVEFAATCAVPKMSSYFFEMVWYHIIFVFPFTPGFGVLHIAAQKDLEELFRALLAKGVDCTLKTKASEVAYQVADGKEKKELYAKLMSMPYKSRCVPHV